VYGATGIPEEGDTFWWGDLSIPVGPGHSQDLFVFATWPHRCVLADEKTTRKLWNVTVRHETPEDFNERGNQGGDPLDEDWEITFDADEWTEEAVKDNQDNPILTSSLEVLKGKQVQVFKSRGRWHLAKNFAAVDMGRLDDLRMSVNSQQLYIQGIRYPSRTLLLRRARSARKVYAKTRYYYRLELEIDANPETHDLKPVDRGRLHYIGTEGPGDPDRKDPKRFAPNRNDKDKSAHADPLPLNGDGDLLTSYPPLCIINQNMGARYYKERNWPWTLP